MLSMLAGSRYTHDAGAAGTVTVPAGVVVTGVICHSTAGGTLTITPKGPNQTGVAQTAIPIPAASDWFRMPLFAELGQLGEGTVLAFTNTDSYLVTYAKLGAGA